MTAPRVDLHLHTFHSDGTFTPEEIVQHARAVGLAAISITDHDSLAGISVAQQAAGSNLEVLPGVELTVSFEQRELHLLGYGFRIEDEPLRAFLTQAQAGRRERIQAMIDRLGEHGMQVSMAEVEAVAQNVDSLGRPHLAEALVRKGYGKSISEIFERYIGDRAPCFVRKARLTVTEAVGMVRAAGGVTVLAHPHRMVHQAWIPELIEQGIQGMEVYHPDHTPSVAQEYRRMAEEHHLLITGGSDFHGLRKPGGAAIGSMPIFYPSVEQLKARLP